LQKVSKLSEPETAALRLSTYSLTPAVLMAESSLRHTDLLADKFTVFAGIIR